MSLFAPGMNYLSPNILKTFAYFFFEKMVPSKSGPNLDIFYLVG